LTRKKKPLNVCIFGRTLNTVAFVSGLINRGVAPGRIKLVIPAITHERKSDFKDNDDRLEYETKCIFGKNFVTKI